MFIMGGYMLLRGVIVSITRSTTSVGQIFSYV